MQSPQILCMWGFDQCLAVATHAEITDEGKYMFFCKKHYETRGPNHQLGEINKAHIARYMAEILKGQREMRDE